MIKVITFFIVPVIFLAITGYWLYFSGWKRGMVQGERVVKAFLSKKIKKILKNEAKIKTSQFNLEKAYLKLGEKIAALEIKKNLKVEEVKGVRIDYNIFTSEHVKAQAGLNALQEDRYRMQQESVMKSMMGQRLGQAGSLFESFFTWLKPPWM